jgi:DNA repair protein RadC
MLAGAHSIIRYLCADMGHLRVETLRALFLDSHNRLLRDETMWTGTIGEVVIHTREVLRRALEVDACAIILAHNHPSGVLRPSASDIELTQDMLQASASLGIIFHDHLIVTANGAISIRFEKIVEPWQ